MSTVPFDVTGAPIAGGVSTRSIGVARLPAQAQLALPRVLLCDLDGTLIDSMPTLADLATEVIEDRYGTPRILARELYLATCGLPFVKQLEEIFPEDPRNAEASADFEARKPARCGAIRDVGRDAPRAAADARHGRSHRRVVEQRHRQRRRLRARRGLRVRPRARLRRRPGQGPHAPGRDLRASSAPPGRRCCSSATRCTTARSPEREGIPFVGVATTFSVRRFALRFPSVPVIRRFSALPELFQ